jgi:signal transduction histidine kinase/CheY-like chemotaxis protein/HPt (histidine-containing phosphotransfer) domain-containing protein
MDDSQAPLRLLRRLNALCNAGVLVALVLDLTNLAGPWIWVALGLSLIGMATFVLVSQLVHRQMRDASEAAMHAISAAKVAVDQAGVQSSEFNALRHELEEHRRLQLELTDAKQAAEAAMLAKGEFLATMSHEVRTPLNGIIPMLDLLQSSKLATDQREMLNTALQSARQLLRIVDDILDYSKLEAHRLQLETVSLNLRELLDSVIRLLERQAQAKGLRLALHIEQDVRASFRGDPLRLRQVISNLVSNALKFTERGSVSVHVTRVGETRSHHQIRIEVRDTGVGISPEAASKLFSAFSQADASTTRLYGGTGLGLAICKRIVDLMGGRIGVESELGRGSVFWLEVPMLKAASEMEAPRIELHGARALVLTADDVLKRRLARALEHWGVKPVYVDTTHDALAKLRGGVTGTPPRGFDLFIADLASIKNTIIALHRNLINMDGAEHVRIVLLEGDDPAPTDLRTMPGSILVRRSLGDPELRVKLVGLLAGETMHPSGPNTRAEVNVAPAAQPEPALGPNGRPLPLKGQLLLVEDNPVNLMVAQRLITLTGLHCDTAENGEQALEKLERGHYDIVLMDCQMPVMDGYTATRAWRENEEENNLQRLPIIAMTANAMAGDRQKCIDAGMDDYLSKPVSRELLENTLRRWLLNAAGERRTSERLADLRPPVVRTKEAALASILGGPPSVVSSAAVATAKRAPEPAHAEVAIMAPSTDEPAPALDSEIIEDLWTAMGDQFKQLVNVFLEDAPGHLAKLEAAVMVGDIDGLIAPAHALKSSSANLGAMQVSAVAKLIEHGARARNLGHPVDTVHRLSLEFQRAEVALRKLLH